MIVNFAVKEQGLEAQLLNTVVKCERPDLDKQKNDLVVTVAQGKRTQVGSSVRPRLHANPDCSHAAPYLSADGRKQLTGQRQVQAGEALRSTFCQCKANAATDCTDPTTSKPLLLWTLGPPSAHPICPLQRRHTVHV